MNNLLLACSQQELGLDHLCSYIKDKMSELKLIKVCKTKLHSQTEKFLVEDANIHCENYSFTVIAEQEIRITIRCSDGHNCAGISYPINNASEEVLTQQGRDTQSVIEQILTDFKSRVDPEDFVQYLTRLKEEDEVSIYTKLYLLKHIIHYLTYRSI